MNKANEEYSNHLKQREKSQILSYSLKLQLAEEIW